MANEIVDLPGEIWKPIAGFPGYHVSNYGRVVSYRHRDGIREDHPKILLAKKRRRARIKYVVYGMSLNKKITYRLAHRLVLENFVGPCPENMEGCHNDGNPLNNHLSNLRWDTHSNNMRDAIAHGFVSPFTILYVPTIRKLQSYEIQQIRMLSSVLPRHQISSGYNVSRKLISDILTGRRRILD